MGSLYVVSDVHGHCVDLESALTRAGLIDESRRWCGGDSELWILGDLTDRGPDGIGVVDLVMALQKQAPDRVRVLMGNHDVLGLGTKRFASRRFKESFKINGGRAADLEALTESHLSWVADLPVIGRVGDYLMVHSDTVAYLGWGTSVDEINSTIAEQLRDGGEEEHWDIFARLTSRYHFARHGGTELAREMLSILGGECIVHGHSIIGSLTKRPSVDVEGPMLYADGLVLAVDGGRYDGGPLLVVRLD